MRLRCALGLSESEFKKFVGHSGRICRRREAAKSPRRNAFFKRRESASCRRGGSEGWRGPAFPRGLCPISNGNPHASTPLVAPNTAAQPHEAPFTDSRTVL